MSPPEPRVEHRHTFAVDCSCECGLMMSTLVRGLTTDNARLLNMLERVIEAEDSDEWMADAVALRKATK